MVFGCIIHSLPEKPGNEPVLYVVQFFTPEGNENDPIHRALQLATLSCEFANDYFTRKSRDKQFEYEGSYSYPLGENSNEKVVCWYRNRNMVYSLICDENDNLSLARMFIPFYHHLLCDHYKNPTFAQHPKEIVTRPESALAFLDQFCPQGLLLFTNSAMAKQLRRETEFSLAGKKQ